MPPPSVVLDPEQFEDRLSGLIDLADQVAVRRSAQLFAVHRVSDAIVRAPDNVFRRALEEYCRIVLAFKAINFFDIDDKINAHKISAITIYAFTRTPTPIFLPNVDGLKESQLNGAHAFFCTQSMIYLMELADLVLKKPDYRDLFACLCKIRDFSGDCEDLAIHLLCLYTGRVWFYKYLMTHIGERSEMSKKH